MVVPKILKSTTIGSEGGSIFTEDFQLIVPAGALSQATDLKLYIEPIEEPFGEFSVSNFFRIVGIPNDYKEPLKVALKYNGAISGVSFIAVGLKDTVRILDTSFVDIGFDLLDVEESNGLLTGEIPTFQISGNALYKNNIDDNILEFFIGAMTKGERWNPFNDHFIVKGVIHEGERARADEIVNYFEQAYHRFKNAGFNYSHTGWPMKLNFVYDPTKTFNGKNIVEVSSAEHVYYPFDRYSFYGARIIYDNSLKDKLQFRGSIDGTYLRVLFGNNKIYQEYGKEILQIISSWAVLKYGFNDPLTKDYILRAVKEWRWNYSNFYTPILIDYFADKYGEQKVWEICKMDSLKQNKYFIQTLIDMFGESEEWLHNFYTRLMTFEDYSQFTDDFWINTCQTKVTIDNNFTSIELPNSYTDLSSNWYHLDLADDFNENKWLRLSTYNNYRASISVVKHKNNERNLITSGQGTVAVPDIKKLSERGDLFVIVTNNEYEEPYNNNTDITLTIEKINELKITGCAVTISGVKGTLLYNDQDYLNDWQVGLAFDKDTDTARITFENNTLIQEYENHTLDNGETFSERIEINFDNEMSSILSFSAHRVEKRLTTGGFYTLTTNLAVNTSIPINYDYNNDPYLNYQLKGTEVCDKITVLSFDKINADGSTLSLKQRTQTCTDGSVINIFIHRE